MFFSFYPKCIGIRLDHETPLRCEITCCNGTLHVLRARAPKIIWDMCIVPHQRFILCGKDLEIERSKYNIIDDTVYMIWLVIVGYITTAPWCPTSTPRARGGQVVRRSIRSVMSIGSQERKSLTIDVRLKNIVDG